MYAVWCTLLSHVDKWVLAIRSPFCGFSLSAVDLERELHHRTQSTIICCPVSKGCSNSGHEYLIVSIITSVKVRATSGVGNYRISCTVSFPSTLFFHILSRASSSVLGIKTRASHTDQLLGKQASVQRAALWRSSLSLLSTSVVFAYIYTRFSFSCILITLRVL